VRLGGSIVITFWLVVAVAAASGVVGSLLAQKFWKNGG